MRFLTFIVLFSTSSFTLHAQETKFVSYGNNHWHKEFYVLKSNEDIRHGSYVWYEYAGDRISILEQGDYQNGKKNGQWSYFFLSGIKHNLQARTSRLKTQVFYKDDKREGAWASYYLDTISHESKIQAVKDKGKKSLTIDMNLKGLKPRITGNYINDVRANDWYAYDFRGRIIQCFDFSSLSLLHDDSMDSVNYNTNHNPLFLGGTAELERCFTEQINPDIALWSGKNPVVILEFIVNRDGGLSEVRALKGKASDKLSEEMIRLLTIHNEWWLPALQNGIAVTKKGALEVQLQIGNRKWNSLGYRITIKDLTQ